MCYKYLVTFKFAHRIYQGQKSSVGARSVRGKQFLIAFALIYPWSTTGPYSLPRSSCLLSRPTLQHGLAPSVGIIFNSALSLLGFQQPQMYLLEVGSLSLKRFLCNLWLNIFFARMCFEGFKAQGFIFFFYKI